MAFQYCFTGVIHLNSCQVFVLSTCNYKCEVSLFMLFSAALAPSKLLTYIKKHLMNFNPPELFLCLDRKSMKHSLRKLNRHKK